MAITHVINNMSFSDFIAVFALVLSIVTISWNIYRDAIQKPKLRGTVSIGNIHHGGEVFGPFIILSFVNHGPGPLNVEMIFIKKWRLIRWLKRESTLAAVMHDYTNPYSTRLPAKLEVGEKITLPIQCEEGAYLATKPHKVGVTDSFGRYHWVTRKSLKHATREFLKRYPSIPFGSIEPEGADA